MTLQGIIYYKSGLEVLITGVVCAQYVCACLFVRDKFGKLVLRLQLLQTCHALKAFFKLLIANQVILSRKIKKQKIKRAQSTLKLSSIEQ